MPPTSSSTMTSPMYEDKEPVNNNVSNVRDESTTTSIMATMNNFVRAVNEMDDTILIPSRLMDMAPDTSDAPAPDSAVVPSATPGNPLNGQSTDMFAFYQMLNAVKSELVQGASDDEEDMNADADAKNDPSSQVAKAFRHHLQGLFDVLKQLTGGAKLLTSRYQEEIGELTSGSATSSLSSFTL